MTAHGLVLVPNTMGDISVPALNEYLKTHATQEKKKRRKKSRQLVRSRKKRILDKKIGRGNAGEMPSPSHGIGERKRTVQTRAFGGTKKEFDQVTGAGVLVRDCDDVVISDIEICGCSAERGAGLGVVRTERLVVHGSRFYENHIEVDVSSISFVGGVLGVGAFIGGVKHTTINQSRFDHNGVDAILTMEPFESIRGCGLCWLEDIEDVPLQRLTLVESKFEKNYLVATAPTDGSGFCQGAGFYIFSVHADVIVDKVTVSDNFASIVVDGYNGQVEYVCLGEGGE